MAAREKQVICDSLSIRLYDVSVKKIDYHLQSELLFYYKEKSEYIITGQK